MKIRLPKIVVCRNLRKPCAAQLASDRSVQTLSLQFPVPLASDRCSVAVSNIRHGTLLVSGARQDLKTFISTRCFALETKFLGLTGFYEKL